MTSKIICGFFSINEDGEFEESICSLRYFKKPKLPIDLNVGIKDIKRLSDTHLENRLNCILRFLVNHKEEYLNKANGDRLIANTPYITSRSVLKGIICSFVHSWDILATKYKGNIYLCKYISPEEVEKQKSRDIFAEYGQMLEHHCQSDHPDAEPDTSKACNPNEKFFCVLKRTFVGRAFLFGAEVDGSISDTPLDPENPSEWKPSEFVEIKLNQKLTKQNEYIFKTFKIHGIWAQSFLAGIQNVYIGFRDNAGIVTQSRQYSINELKQISQKNWTFRRSYKEQLDHILNKIESHLKDVDCPYTTIKYHYDKSSKVLTSTLFKGEHEYRVLPDWFLEQMK